MKRFQQLPRGAGKPLPMGRRESDCWVPGQVVRAVLLRVGRGLRREVALLVTFRNSEGKRALGVWSGGGVAGSHLHNTPCERRAGRLPFRFGALDSLLPLVATAELTASFFPSCLVAH